MTEIQIRVDQNPKIPIGTEVNLDLANMSKNYFPTVFSSNKWYPNTPKIENSIEISKWIFLEFWILKYI